MAASQGVLVSGSEFREDLFRLSVWPVSLRCLCSEDASGTPGRVSFGDENAVAAVPDGLVCDGAGSDSNFKVAVLYFDFSTFERAIWRSHEHAIELWARWHSVVPCERKFGARKQYISVPIEVSLCSWLVCACVLGRSFLSSLRGLVLLALRLCLCPKMSSSLQSGLYWTSRCFTM